MIELSFQAALYLFVLVLARAGMFVATLPQFGSLITPALAKLGLTLALTFFWFAEADASGAAVLFEAPHQNSMAWAWAILRELFVGGMLGITFSLILVPFRVAGEFVGQEMGLTLATITDPTRVQFGTTVGQFFEMIGAMLMLSLDVHHIFVVALHASWIRRPLGGDVGGVPVAAYMKATVHTQEWGLLLAAPIVCCLFATTLILALMARTAPQMNIMSVGFALRIAVGIVASFVFFPDLAPAMHAVLERCSQMFYAFV